MIKSFPAAQTQWSPALVVDIAINETSLTGPVYSIEDLCSLYHLTEEEFLQLKNIPAFKKEVRDAIIEVKQNGLTPKKKMAIMYEYILSQQVPIWLTDADFPATGKVKLFVHLGKGSGLVVDKPPELNNTINLGMPTLNIILTQEAPVEMKVVEDSCTIENLVD